MKKVSNTKTEFKKSVASKKKRVKRKQLSSFVTVFEFKMRYFEK